MKNGQVNTAGVPTVEPKRVAIYTRKSTDKGLERDFNSLDAQREACEQYIKSQAHLCWKLTDVHYDDGGFTGANIDRPAFARLLADIEAGQIDVVVVYKVDRLSRSLLDFAKVMDRFNQAGAAFVSVTQNFSTADAMGRLTLNVLMSFAEFEREMISERTRDKIAGSRRRGKWTGGAVPIGYEAQDKKLVIVEHEAHVVRDIFERYLDRQSALEIAQHLNETHQLTKQRTTSKGRIRQGRDWTKDTVLRILKNAVYAGFMPYRDEVYEGEHEAIIDAATFHRVAVYLKKYGAGRTGKPRSGEYLLSGRLYCVCGYAMTAKGTRKKKGGTTKYRYYQCVMKDKLGRRGCESRPLPAGAIEGFVVARIRDVTADGSVAEEVARRMDTYFEKKRKALDDEHKELPKKIAELSAEIRKLIDTIIDVNESARRQIETRIDELGHAMGKHELRLVEVERTLTGLDDLQSEGRWVSGALKTFDTVWDVMSPGNRLRLIEAVVKKVVVNEPENQVTVLLNDLGATERDDDDGDEPATDEPPATAPEPAAMKAGP